MKYLDFSKEDPMRSIYNINYQHDPKKAQTLVSNCQHLQNIHLKAGCLLNTNTFEHPFISEFCLQHL